MKITLQPHDNIASHQTTFHINLDGNIVYRPNPKSSELELELSRSGDVLILRGISERHTITNQAETVISLLSQLMDTLPPLLIYQDMRGDYDGLHHENGFFKNYVLLDTCNESEAIERIREASAHGFPYRHKGWWKVASNDD